jgi:hypothetical protein
MLQSQGLRAAAGYQPPEAFGFSYITSSYGSTAQSQTFSGVSFGAASASRRIYVGVTAGSSTNGATISSATIGGVSATIFTLKASGGSFSTGVHNILVASVPSGTTGDISITYSAGLNNPKNIHVYRVVGQTTAVGSVLHNSTQGQGASTSTGRTVTTVNGSFAITLLGMLNARDPSLSGATRNNSGSQVSHAGSASTTGANLSITWSWTSSVGFTSSMASFKV